MELEKRSVDIHHPSAHFGAILAEAAPGQELIITEAGQPRAVLAPIPPKR